MRIKQANIYGFGKWVDHTIEFPEERFVCLYGENESGKSTLQKFFMFMLFGFPPKERKFYQSKTSSRMGGRLMIEEDEIGVYTIERIDGVRNGAAKCYLPNGEERDEVWLRKRLNGMDAAIFEAIFSFSAHDLVTIKNMKDEDLGEILLNIGLTGYSNIYEIEKQLNRELDNLFKPNGTRPTINEQLNLLDEQNKKVIEIKSEIMTYREQQEMYETLQNELQQLRDQFESEQKKKGLIDKHINNLKSIYEFFSNQKQLELLPEDLSFPEEGIERLKMIQGYLLPIIGERSVIVDNEKGLLKTHEEAEQQLLQQSIYDEGKQVIQLERDYDRNKDEISRCRHAIEKLSEDITSKLDQLQIGLQQEEVDQLTFPFHIEQQWNELKQQFEQLNREKEHLDEQFQSLIKQRQLILTEQNQLEDQLLREDVKQAYEQQLKSYTAFTEQKQLYQEASAKKQQWNKLQAKKKKEQNLTLVISILLSIVSAGLAFFINIPTLYYVMAVIIVIGLGQWVMGNRSLRETELLLQSETVDNGKQITITNQEKEEIESALKEDQDARISLKTIEKELRQIKMKQIDCEDKLVILNQDENKLDEKIAEQVKRYSFLGEIDVLYWPKLFHAVRHVVEKAKEVNELTEQMESLEEKQYEINEKLILFLQKTGDHDKDRTNRENFKRVHECLLRHENLLRHMNHLKEQLTENQQQKQELTKKMNVYQEEKSSLFSIAKVKSEEEFYQKANTFDEKKQIERALFKAKEQLQMVYTEIELEKLTDLNLDEHYLKNEQHNINETIKQINIQIEEKREEQAQLFAVLQKLESSESYSEALHRFSMDKDRLNELALNWSVLQMASEILTETKKTYQSNYLSKIIDQMTAYFKEITGDAYIQIFPPTKDRPFQVEAASGIRYTVDELSQGTIDQLYISLRIVMGKMVSEEHNLPFIIDDAFVHFDSIRLQRMINIITSIAERQQIVMFTCKQEIINLLQEKHVVSLDSLPTVRIK